MLWFYSRAGETRRVETRFDEETNEFVLVITATGRPTQTERFPTEDDFKVRVTALERELEHDRWTQIGRPEILSEGWRGPTSS